MSRMGESRLIPPLNLQFPSQSEGEGEGEGRAGKAWRLRLESAAGRQEMYLRHFLFLAPAASDESARYAETIRERERIPGRPDLRS